MKMPKRRIKSDDHSAVRPRWIILSSADTAHTHSHSLKSGTLTVAACKLATALTGERAPCKHASVSHIGAHSGCCGGSGGRQAAAASTRRG